jgi:tryptophanyl-tRNA synthetase
VDPKTEDKDHEAAGGLFPIPEALVGRVGRLVGVDGKQKMSKSLGNAIFLSDDPKTVKKKVGQIFTGRQTLTEPGDTSNALFQYVRAFVKDPGRVAELERRYATGDNIGDGHVKAEVADAVSALLEPMRARRAEFEKPGGDDAVIDIIKAGTTRGNVLAEGTLHRAKQAMRLDYGPRRLS